MALFFCIAKGADFINFIASDDIKLNNVVSKFILLVLMNFVNNKVSTVNQTVDKLLDRR